METLRDIQPPADPIVTPDQAMFDRVWGRVMAQPEQTAPKQSPAVTGPYPCLGEESARYLPLLGEVMAGIYASWQEARALSRQAQGSQARTLTSLAQSLQSQLRQLSAAYFLISGQRLAQQPMPISQRQTMPDALRALFMAERQRQQLLAQRAGDIADPCLQSLFQDLAQESGVHMDLIRTLLEGLSL